MTPAIAILPKFLNEFKYKKRQLRNVCHPN
jgi:hypothetical protein